MTLFLDTKRVDEPAYYHNGWAHKGWIHKKGLLTKEEFEATETDKYGYLAPLGLGMHGLFSSHRAELILNGEQASVTMTLESKGNHDIAYENTTIHSTVMTQTMTYITDTCIAESIKFGRKVGCCFGFISEIQNNEYGVREFIKAFHDELPSTVLPYVSYMCLFSNEHLLTLARTHLLHCLDIATKTISGEVYLAEEVKLLEMTNV